MRCCVRYCVRCWCQVMANGYGEFHGTNHGFLDDSMVYY